MTKVIVNEELCKGCELCITVCPKGALALGDKANSKGYYSVELVKPDECNSCTLCGLMCPDVALKIYRAKAI